MQKVLLAASISVLLSACSGGGGGSSSPSTIGGGSKAGQLQLGTAALDIDGLGFKTATIDATTVDGKFSYNEGETVTFMLGNNELFSVTGSQEQSVNNALLKNFQLPSDQKSLELALHKRPGLNNNTNLSPIHKISNTIKLLLVLDSDKDSSNGIDLTDWHTKLASTAIELNTRFDDNQAFYNTFQNQQAPDLIHPTYLDVASPLVYLYSAANIQVEAEQISQIESVSSANIKITTDYTYDNAGRITQSIEKNLGEGSTPSSISTTQYKYDKIGFATEKTKKDENGLSTSSPTTELSITKTQTTGYLNINGELTNRNATEEVSEGPALDNLTVSYSSVSTFDKDKLIKEVSTSSEGSEDTYTNTYDAQGRVIFSTTIEGNNQRSETTTRTSGQDAEGNIENTYNQQNKNTATDELTANYYHVYTYNDKNQITTDKYKHTNSAQEISTNTKVDFTYTPEGIPTIKTKYKYEPLTSDSNLIADGIDKDTYNESGVLVSQQRQFSTRTKKYSYTFSQAEQLNKGRYTKIEWTEAYNTDLESPFRTQTFNFVYDVNTELLAEMNFEQIYEGNANSQRKITYLHNDKQALKELTNTFHPEGVTGTEAISTHTISYQTIANGIGYIANNQLRKSLSQILSNDTVEFDVVSENIPSVIDLPREE